MGTVKSHQSSVSLWIYGTWGCLFEAPTPTCDTLYPHRRTRRNENLERGRRQILPSIRHARQNGVAILEHDPATGKGIPGPYVANWMAGNLVGIRG